jgi:SAM-dependent methyltransferase
MFRRPLIRRLRARLIRERDSASLIEGYLQSGRIPWSPGYKSYKRRFLERIVRDASALEGFRRASPLPPDYGWRLDERVVEYPWVFSRLGPGPLTLLDAGSTLNAAYLLELPMLRDKKMTVMTLAPEGTVAGHDVTYVYGDLRDTGLADAAFDVVVCVSTLEHIGLDNTKLYTDDARFRESMPLDYQRAVAEFRRVLKPGGRVLITVPFGRAQRMGWAQQFDAAGLARISEAFGADPDEGTFYRYHPEGWRLSTAAECAGCEYFDVHAAKAPAPDGAAAARAVACLSFIKSNHAARP